MTPIDEALAAVVRTVVREELDRWQRAEAPARLAFTVKEAAEVSGASAYDLRRAITAGQLTARKAGEGLTSKYLIPLDCLQAWLHGLPQPTGRKR